MIRSKQEKMNFGKYFNKSIQWVITNDPGYIIWSYQNVSTVNYSDAILLEAIKKSKK